MASGITNSEGGGNATGWKTIYNNFTGFELNGQRYEFGTVNVGDLFRIEIKDQRNGFTQIGTVRINAITGGGFEGIGSEIQYDSSNDRGVGYRIRTFFVATAPTIMWTETQASQVSSAGNTNWHGENNFRAVRVDKEVYL